MKSGIMCLTMDTQIGLPFLDQDTYFGIYE